MRAQGRKGNRPNGRGGYALERYIARKGAPPPFRSLPPVPIAPAKPALEADQQLRTGCFSRLPSNTPTGF
jgi:hypothetical protein